MLYPSILIVKNCNCKACERANPQGPRLGNISKGCVSNKEITKTQSDFIKDSQGMLVWHEKARGTLNRSRGILY